jgi:hypothetical protein
MFFCFGFDFDFDSFFFFFFFFFFLGSFSLFLDVSVYRFHETSNVEEFGRRDRFAVER